jgi:hypothetical protein
LPKLTNFFVNLAFIKINPILILLKLTYFTKIYIDFIQVPKEIVKLIQGLAEYDPMQEEFIEYLKTKFKVAIGNDDKNQLLISNSVNGKRVLDILVQGKYILYYFYKNYDFYLRIIKILFSIEP